MDSTWIQARVVIQVGEDTVQPPRRHPQRSILGRRPRRLRLGTGPTTALEAHRETN